MKTPSEQSIRNIQCNSHIASHTTDLCDGVSEGQWSDAELDRFAQICRKVLEGQGASRWTSIYEVTRCKTGRRLGGSENLGGGLVITMKSDTDSATSEAALRAKFDELDIIQEMQRESQENDEDDVCRKIETLPTKKSDGLSMLALGLIIGGSTIVGLALVFAVLWICRGRSASKEVRVHKPQKSGEENKADESEKSEDLSLV